ncbi:MAG TPA: zf-HC2 domain-containing protein [Galbitalea sp.]|nr:zf-HC2 domain-containing protein [Galbitalea sp.]
MTDPDDQFRDWDAAYVLGALDADDRRAFERHLATCAECSAAVAEFAGLPGILSKLSSEDAVGLLSEDDVVAGVDDHLRDGTHTPGLVQRLAVASSRRRRRTRFAMVGAAVAVVALLAAGGIVYTASQPTAVATVAMAPLHQHVVTAKMKVTAMKWGTRFDWSCSYYHDVWSTPESYDLVVTTTSGATSTVATWSSTGPHAADLSASSDIAIGDIRSIEIRLTGTTKPLLRETL